MLGSSFSSCIHDRVKCPVLSLGKIKTFFYILINKTLQIFAAKCISVTYRSVNSSVQHAGVCVKAGTSAPSPGEGSTVQGRKDLSGQFGVSLVLTVGLEKGTNEIYQKK